ncbi:hypothetical protein J7077_004805 [Vibrio parahaemolyticus]|nr:hypothetical protein [Vibrio parahaemolyticus]EHH2552315.1 hypothetical protein [Vibrio parahaemolyticus]EHH3642042.1 hypothetical protein [Vibrio parahaemolyticus]ELA9863519.1 hypothetical protein [Vibrio parahaemolyticus]ELH3013496.1 hypothetical protein [Vibrio parahaemolyticus]
MQSQVFLLLLGQMANKAFKSDSQRLAVSLRSSIAKRCSHLNAALELRSNMISELIEISQLSVPVIAVASVFIAWQQYSANREKLKLDLYDRRFKIYDIVVQSIYSTQFGLGEYDENEYAELYTAVNEAQFLLPENVYKVITKSQKHIRLHRELLRRREKLNDTPENTVRLAEIQRIIEDSEPKLEKLVEELTEQFVKVLKIRKF